MVDNDIIEIEGIKFYAPNKNDVIYREMIKTNQIWEKSIVEKLCSFIYPESCVVDVGAHVGNHTIQFAKYAKKVISFEPSEDNYRIFEINIQLNSIDNVVLYKIAVCDKKGFFGFDPGKDIKRRKNSGATYLIEDINGYIEGDTLDNILIDISDPISLIKYDVEEMELSALMGSINIIEKFRPILYVEFIKDKKRVRSCSGKVVSFLNNIGYAPYQNEKEIWKFRGE